MSSPAASWGRPAVLASIALVGALELYIGWLALNPQVDDHYRAYYIDQTTTCLDKPVSGNYVLGRTVSFLPDDQPAARRLRVCGWDGPVGDGTHSVGTRSMLHFALPEAVDGLILRLQLTAIEAPDGRQQHVVVSGNGVPLGDVTIPPGASRAVDFAVPAALTAEGELDVALDYPTATEMMPDDSDTHYRSIKLTSVQLRRLGDPPSRGAQDDPASWLYVAPAG